MKSMRNYLTLFAAIAWVLSNGLGADAQTRVSIGVTETIETHNPYGDSVSLLYGIFSEVTGPFCTYNYARAISRAASPSAGKSKTRRRGISI